MSGAEQTKDDWHAADIERVLDRVETTPEGLSRDQAERRSRDQGPNRITERGGRTAWQRLWGQFANSLIIVLLGAMVVMAAIGDWMDATAVGAVVIINAVIGFVQEGRAQKALDAVRRSVANTATVLRDGKSQRINAEEVAVGDVVEVKSGDLVPADMRLLETSGFAVQEAALTGESEAVGKSIDPVGVDAALADRTSMAYAGTVVARGRGQGVVVAIGDGTQVGHIGQMLAETGPGETPLALQLRIFSRWLTGGILVLAVVIFAVGTLVHSLDPFAMFEAAVGLAIAAIPEALPAILTITMAIGVTRMAERRAIIRRLPAVETLGSVNVICADKTGTLTRNELQVCSAITDLGICTVEGEGYDPSGQVRAENDQDTERSRRALEDLARAALFCSDAELVEKDGRWRVEGDLTDGAITVFAHKALDDPRAERERNRRIDAVPYEADRQYMASLNKVDGASMVFVKGAPERIVALCDTSASAEGDEPIDRDRWLKVVEERAGQGERLLAVARRAADRNADRLRPEDVDAGGFTLVGLCGMIDPPRAEAKSSIATCHAAGIDVKMITGDHALTATAVARPLGIEGETVTGPELEKLDDEAFARSVRESAVIARATPENKIRMVEALQAGEQTVAMTGDGFNDAPALSKADVGVAMGESGTDAAKQAAEIVLTDDNIASIVSAVEEGRTVYDNVRKAILYILPTSLGEAGVIILAVMLGQTLPITALQILWTNLVTEVTLSVSIAFDKPAPDIMQRPPRRRNTPLLSRFLVWRIGFVAVFMTLGAYGLFLWRRGDGSIEEARTIVVNSFVLFEIAYLFNCRYVREPVLGLEAFLGNKITLLSVGTVLLLQLAFTYLGFMNAIFGSAPLSLGDWSLAAAIAVGLFVAVEAEKWIRNAIGGKGGRPANTGW